MALLTCSSCEGFLLPTSRSCPHCGVMAMGLGPTIGRALIAVAGGSALSLTMMACYGSPPCADDEQEDKDGDGFFVAKEDAFCLPTGVPDCDDDDAAVNDVDANGFCPCEDGLVRDVETGTCSDPATDS